MLLQKPFGLANLGQCIFSFRRPRSLSPVILFGYEIKHNIPIKIFSASPQNIPVFENKTHYASQIGTWITWPMWRLPASPSALAETKASSVIPSSAAMRKNVSPLWVVYVDARESRQVAVPADVRQLSWPAAHTSVGTTRTWSMERKSGLWRARRRSRPFESGPEMYHG